MNQTLDKQFKDQKKNRAQGGMSIYDTEVNYDVSQGHQNLTGRTPVTILNSTLTEKVAGGTSMG